MNQHTVKITCDNDHSMVYSTRTKPGLPVSIEVNMPRYIFVNTLALLTPISYCDKESGVMALYEYVSNDDVMKFVTYNIDMISSISFSCTDHHHYIIMCHYDIDRILKWKVHVIQKQQYNKILRVVMSEINTLYLKQNNMLGL